MREGRITPALAARLNALAHALGGRDFRSAQRAVQDMASADWKDVREWHAGVRSLVTMGVTKGSLLGL